MIQQLKQQLRKAHKALEREVAEGALSPAAIANPPPFDRARSAVAYTGVARRMVQALKYNDRTDLAPWMARWMMPPAADGNRAENTFHAKVAPEAGKLLMFPSWLEHGVAQNQTETERISMSFNFEMRPKSTGVRGSD